MLIPPQTLFIFNCTEHNVPLAGEPMLSHPNDEATLVWVFDTSKMYCTHDIRHTVDESGCSDKWEVRA